MEKGFNAVRINKYKNSLNDRKELNKMELNETDLIKVTPAQAKELEGWEWHSNEENGDGYLKSLTGEHVYQYSLNPFGLEYKDPVDQEWKPLDDNDQSMSELKADWEKEVIEINKEQQLDLKPFITYDKLWIDVNNGEVNEVKNSNSICLKEAEFMEDTRNNQVILKGKSYGKEIQTVLPSEEFALGNPFRFSKEIVSEVTKRKNEIYHEQQLSQKERV